MAVYYCKLITTEYAPDAESRIKAFLRAIPIEADYQTFVPYWKNPSQGELTFTVHFEKPATEIRSLLADHWQDDVADAQWCTIHCPATSFIWLTA